MRKFIAPDSASSANRDGIRRTENRLIRTLEKKLDYIRAATDENLQVYEQGIQSAIETYSIQDTAFNNPKALVIVGAIRLLSEYQVDPLCVNNPESILYVLAIFDTWISSNKLSEKKALLDILKLVVTGIKADKEYGTYSKKVKGLSNQGKPRGTQFDPDATTSNTHINDLTMLNDYINNNHDPRRTKQVSEIINNWDNNSHLHHVRQKLGIENPQGEKPFQVIVLNKTANQMMEYIGRASLCIFQPNSPNIMVFNSDYHIYNSLEHEYAHSQSEGLNFGYQNILFRGIDEAATENSTLRPKTYLNQRLFFNFLLQKHREYEETIYKAYVGNKESRSKMLSLLVDNHNLVNFLTIARVSPIDNPEHSGKVGASIYIDPLEALRLLKFIE